MVNKVRFSWGSNPSESESEVWIRVEAFWSLLLKIWKRMKDYRSFIIYSMKMNNLLEYWVKQKRYNGEIFKFRQLCAGWSMQTGIKDNFKLIYITKNSTGCL